MAKEKMWVQAVDFRVNLVGGAEVGLPAPDWFLAMNPNIQCVEITDPEAVQEYLYGGKFYSGEQWQAAFPAGVPDERGEEA